MDWVAWHRAYDDPSSALARRLHVVRRRLGDLLDGRTAPTTILSLCAGDGRDVLGVLAGRAGSPPAAAVLVEQDGDLVRRAQQAAATDGLGAVEIRHRDAGDPTSFADVVPVDVLLLCGIFGNVEPAAVRDVVEVVPSLLTAGGSVIWTRGASDPDHRPEIRRWFEQAGLDEVSFDGAPATYGVGVNHRSHAAVPDRAVPDRLFTFTR